MMQPGPQAMTADAGAQSAGGQATLMWGGGQFAVDTGQGPQPVDDIGAALQAVLDAYKASAESMPGESSFMAAFGKDAKQGDRMPTARDSAGATRY